jgi:hypothetical protein
MLRSPATQAVAPATETAFSHVDGASAPVAYPLDRQDARWRSLNFGAFLC